jgi:protein-disulfide isomerase
MTSKDLTLSAKVMVVIAAALSISSARAADCLSIQPGILSTISQYVQKKAKLPPDTILVSRDEGLFSGTCFRKIKTTSTDNENPFAQTFFLSPDQRALTPAVFNLEVDPLAEERQARLSLQREVMTGNRPVIGRPEADLTLAMFSDFQCPYCKTLATAIEKLLPEEKRLKIIYRYLPLESHSWAREAAEAGSCIFRQGNDAFWAFHDAIFAAQTNIDKDNFRDEVFHIAGSITGIDASKMQHCLDAHLGEADVTEDLQMAADHEIAATPTIILNGFAIPGARSAEELKLLIETISPVQQ